MLAFVLAISMAPEGSTEVAATADVAPAPVADVAPAPAADVAPAPASGSVDEAVWPALVGKRVRVQTESKELEGELASADGAEVVVIGDDGRPVVLPKSSVTDVVVARAPAASAGAPASRQAPAPAGEESKPEAAADEAESDDPKARRKARREKREHALLGAFTAHGASYAHWRGDGISAGYAAYAMDWGIGINPAKSFGMYAVGGGLLGARIDDKSIRANAGKLALMFAFGGKYYFSMIGAGVAFSRLKMPEELQKDVGVAVPFKIFGRLPLPKKLYIGIGIAYEFMAVRGFSRFVNGIGAQIVFGRW
jgi:hypothetical protein